MGRFDAEIQLAVEHRGFTLLGVEIGASDVAEIVAADWSVGDHDAQIVGGQPKGNGALIEQGHSVMHFNPVRLQIEDRLDRRPAGVFLCLWRGLIGAAVGINDEMNGGTVDFQKVETKLGIHQREDLGPRIKPIHMGIGQLARALQAVNREAIHFHREMAEIPAQRLQLPRGHRWRPGERR